MSRLPTKSTGCRARRYGATLALVGLAGVPLAVSKLSQTLPARQPATVNYSASLSSLKLGTSSKPRHPITAGPLAVSPPGPTSPVPAKATTRPPGEPAVSAPPVIESTSPGSAPGPGIFLQVSSLSPTYSVADVHNWLAQVCSSGTSSAGPTIVLQDIVNTTGHLNIPYLNAIVPYLPGNNNCFSKAYIGTEGITYNGPGSLYQQGVETSSVAEQYETQSTSLAKQFKDDYPSVTTNWYLTLEANLNDFTLSGVVSAYSSILPTEINQLSTIDPSASFLWSPGFWYTYSGYSSNTYGMGLLQQGLATLFQRLTAATQQPVTLDLQDEVGTTNCWGTGAMTPQDAVDWAHFLTTIPAHPTIEMNTTLFQTSCTTGGTTPISQTQANDTEQYYQSNGITLGPAYEIRYWLTQHNLSLTMP